MENGKYTKQATRTAGGFSGYSSSCKIDGTAHNETGPAFTALATEASKVAEAKIELRLGLGPGIKQPL